MFILSDNILFFLTDTFSDNIFFNSIYVVTLKKYFGYTEAGYSHKKRRVHANLIDIGPLTKRSDVAFLRFTTQGLLHYGNFPFFISI